MQDNQSHLQQFVRGFSARLVRETAMQSVIYPEPEGGPCPATGGAPNRFVDNVGDAAVFY